VSQSRSLPVPDGLEGERVDSGLARLLGISRSRAAELAGEGAVTVKGRPVGKSDRLIAGEWLEVLIPEPPTMPEPAEVSGMVVIYEDADVVVVDKPIGVAAHASPGWDGPTVVGGLRALGYVLADAGADERQGVVHRLDVGTSGVMVVARTDAAYRDLKRQFKQRSVSKTYHALVQGHPDPTSGTIDAPIGRHPSHDYRFAVVAGGRPSITHYETLEGFRYATLLSIGLETGRTHQIRVHMAAIRHPCVGDLTYGADPVLARRLGLSRQWLHAVRLEFAQPTSGRSLVIESAYPADLAGAVEALRD
jgi:23S rRNA pseudouridine1911/1915/1917 synthase